MILGEASAAIVPAQFDMEAVRDASTLEIRVIQDWQPVVKAPGLKQKLIEITVCEWWPGQKVRLPVTLCAPLKDQLCKQVVVSNMGLALNPALPTPPMQKLLRDHGVGVVLVGMSTIDAMEPKGKLHLGMKQQLLRTKDARYTPAWIWGMSDMRALTAALTETRVFQPEKVLVTGGSKRGVGAAICGIHDSRFTAILPVVAPMLGNPGGAYVRGSALGAETVMNEAFLQELPPGRNPLHLPATARQALLERDERRQDQSISKAQAEAAGWSEAEMQQMNDEAWRACQIAYHLPAVQQRGLTYFYHVGSNDNVCPGLREMGQQHPDFPLYILPGGQHGGPASSGFTLQTPAQKEAEENFIALAKYHFFGLGAMPKAPRLSLKTVGSAEAPVIRVTVHLAPGSPVVADRNRLSWCVNRHPPYTLATEYDRWQSVPLTSDAEGALSAEIPVPADAQVVDFISTHTQRVDDLPFHFSSSYQRWSRP